MAIEGETENPLFEELLWVHSMIRRDLEIVSDLARAVTAGEDAGAIRERLGELRTNGPLWQLKVNCLHYCRFVHSHHRLEDIALFPTMRRVHFELDPIIDKLEADHREVSALLQRVETACETLVDEDLGGARDELGAALDSLAEILLAHLAFEERSLEAPLGRMKGWSG
jgi:ribosomal 50S subunit-associated protein YjgA (DUF615 family)